MKELVLFTAQFPYGSSETFLETEILYLAESFDKVLIVVTDNVEHLRQRDIPSNCSIMHLTLDFSLKTKLLSLLGVLDFNFWEEIKQIKYRYQNKITFLHLKIVLLSLLRAKFIKKFVLNYAKGRVGNIVFYSYWCTDPAIGIGLAKKKNMKICGISRIHGWDVNFHVHNFKYLPFRNLLSKNLNKIVSISENGVEAVKDQWKTNTSNVIINRLGSKKQNQLDFRYNTMIQLVSCSNLIPLKRVHLIVNALKIFDKKVHWTHFGDGILMEELKNQVNELPPHIIVNLEGRIPNQEIFKKYVEIKPHIFINVSSSEGVPVSIMEAMSFGIPCIATNVGGNSEIVTNANGFLLSSNPTENEIISAIENVYENHQSKSNYAYLTWFENYNAEKNYTEFSELLLNMLK